MAPLSDFVNVDGLVSAKDLLILVDGEYQALLGDFLDGAGLGHGDVDARLQHRGGDHEDDQQDQHPVHQPGYIDLRQQTLAELDSLPSLTTVSFSDVRLMIEARGLYAKGIGFADANLLASCLATPGTKIWTLDNRLGKVADALGIHADSRLLVN